MSVQTSDYDLFAARMYQPRETLPYSSNLTVDYSIVTAGRCALTGDVTIEPPINPVDGARLELWLNADGGTRNLSFAGAIIVPSESAFTSPVALTGGKTYIVLLKYDAVTNGGQWELVSIVGGY